MDVREIRLDDILLDVRNPRIAHATEPLAGTINQDWIKVALGHAAPEDEEKGSSTTYSSLKGSIRAHGGLINPIIVTPREDGRYLVVEGNTRVAIYRELIGDGSPGAWETIPAIVQPDLREEGEHAIRLQAHLVGPRPWRPYNKAKYLHDLYVNQKWSITQIEDFCGGRARRREIEDYIAAYKDMQNEYVPIAAAAGGPPDYTRFSAFVELQAIKAPLVRSGFSEADFANWVHTGKLSPQQTVRQLPRILSNTEARRQFLAHNAREALKVLDRPSATAVIGSATLGELADALAARLRSLSWAEVQQLMQNRAGAEVRSMTDCSEELKSILQAVSGTEADD